MRQPNGVLEDAFSEIKSVRELSDGRLLVADRLEGFLYLVDWSRSAVDTIGRNGEGPGEYQRPGYLYALAGDSTLFTDFNARRWFVLSGAQIVETIPASNPLASLFGPDLSGADESSRILGVVGFANCCGDAAGARGSADSLRLLLGRLGGVDGRRLELDTVARLGGLGRFGMRVVREPPYVMFRSSPLGTEEQARLFSDGWLAVAHTDPYRVDWRSPDGHWAYGFDLPFTAMRVDRAEMCFTLERQGLDQDLDRCDPARRNPDWPATMPAFLPGALLPAPDGTLVVKRTPHATDPRNRYDVIDRAGAHQATIALPANESIVGFGRSSVYVVRKAPIGLETLIRYHWSNAKL